MALRDKIESLSLQQRGQEPFDSAAVLKEWKAAVETCYADMERWLADYISAGQIGTSREPITIQEELLGEYAIDRLLLDIGSAQIVIEPKARYVIGADGRIDLYRRGYRNDQSFFIIGNRRAVTGWAWDIVSPRQRRQIDPLTREKFEESLDKLL